MATWTEHDIPDQSGRTVLVTGANSGLGLRTAQVLAGAGARVLLACRSPERGAAALATVSGDAELVSLDLADLAAVRRTAEQVRERTGDQLDVLINNAGVMALAHRSTADGFELQFGTNHLGHAALTWLLMPALRNPPAARVVTVGSLSARFGRIDLTDPNFERRSYNTSAAYGQAKLANLLFSRELHRRATAAGLDLVSVAAHPGYTATSLGTSSVAGGPSWMGPVMRTAYWLGDRLLAQRVRTGALPQLYAATAADVRGGEYYGPGGLAEMRGLPARARPPKAALDTDTATRLWTLTAELTGVKPDPA
jgi:NAD(P)-dependent dehydrogenase (short-subunit alcohol dehydrogenase family)